MLGIHCINAILRSLQPWALGGSGEADTFLGNHLVSLCRPGWVYQTVCIHGIYRALAARNNKKLTTFTYLLCLSLLRAHVWMLGQFSEFVMSCHVGFGNQVQIVSLVALEFNSFYFKIFYFPSPPPHSASIKGVEVNNWSGCWGAWAVLCPCRQEILSFPCQLGKCPSDTSSIPEASFELIPLPITGFSVGQPEMAPQSESSNGFSNAQGKMSSREESTLQSCSGKWGQWRS